MSVERTCPDCGTAYTVRFPSTAKAYCSRRCAASQAARRRTAEANSNWRGGNASHPLYDVYNDMVGRCERPTHPRWASYGGRGIKVCDRWLEDFRAFVADVGERPEGVGPTGRALYSLDRIDNDGNYEPGNCRWATYQEQRRNRRDSRRVGA